MVTPKICSLGQVAVRHRCKFSCASGYKLVGSRSARCKRDSEWKHNGGAPKCIPQIEPAVVQNENEFTLTTTTTTTTSTTPQPPEATDEEYIHHHPTLPSYIPTTVATTTEVDDYTSPFIFCPPDVVKDLPSDSATTYIRIPQPKTNVNWYEFVKATPDWAKQLEAEMGLGKTLVTFQAMSPISEDSASCSFTIHVRDTVPPRVYNCPGDFSVYLDEGQEKRQVKKRLRIA